ncbi:hypothetical protein UCRPA7_3148 [Phaeoacremonium minimum UCRPA7]|uniref:Apple domain-containing protein n=1 Tax=Phaeoacremonium minimum (strain UCR-PA7) TaxID=1286976 RepID=R8BPR4_PHAM7|nr:hypothetical protein UCRPA7_3148 [Phaeoacremonium minimum UCRPA7]EOO01353.1 hypothetical protein UCRPA7_3148 [Phaeoacremonium minimum UCRPA7]
MNHGSYDPTLPEKPPVAGRICGLRKQVFWAVVAIGVFAIVAAIAIGVGVGIATRNNGDDSTPANATQTVPVSGTPTNGLPAATAAATLGPEVEINCPDANQTLYTLQDDSTRKFLMLCGRDYSSQNGDGAVDMFSEDIDTMTGCIERCANQSGCAAVGWGDYYGTKTCWLKSEIGKPNVSPQWYAAVEADEM